MDEATARARLLDALGNAGTIAGTTRGTDAGTDVAADAGGGERAVANFLLRGPSVPEAVPTRIDFERELAAAVVDDVIGFARSLAQRELVPYDPSFQPSSGQALIDDLAETGHPFSDLASVLLTGDLPLDRHDNTAPIVALAHRIESSGAEPILALRFKGPGIATKRPSGLSVLLPRGGVYVRVKEQILWYQPRFDALVVGPVLFVTAPSTLQRSIGSPERAQQLARMTFSRATAEIRIDGVEELSAAVASDPAMMAKMAQLSRTLAADPGYADFLTTGRLVAFLDANPQIPIAMAGTGADRHVVFESSPQKRYLIPKTLADDFLRSELTDRRYEAGSKHRIDDDD